MFTLNVNVIKYLNKLTFKLSQVKLSEVKLNHLS